MKLIGIAAQLGNGKDVLGNYLAKTLNAKQDRKDYQLYREYAKITKSLSGFCTSDEELTDQEVAFQLNILRGSNIIPTATNRWQRVAFADAVKNVYCDAFNVDRGFIEAWKRNPEPPPGMDMNVRKSLQFIGDGFRNIQKDIWIQTALRDETRKLIISDSRYVNEARAIKKKGGTMVVIYREGFLNDEPNLSESQIGNVVRWCLKTNQKDGLINNTLPDECYTEDVTREVMSNYDYFLRNDGSEEDFHAKADKHLVSLFDG